MEKLDLIIQKINAVPINTKNGKKVKNQMIDFYVNNPEKMERVEIQDIETFDYKGRVLEIALNLDKTDYFIKYKSKKVKGLETHTYCPELNTLIFIDGSEFRTPQRVSIESAVAYLVQKLTFEQIRAL